MVIRHVELGNSILPETNSFIPFPLAFFCQVAFLAPIGDGLLPLRDVIFDDWTRLGVRGLGLSSGLRPVA